MMPRDPRREAQGDKVYTHIGMRVSNLGDMFTSGYVGDIELRGLSIRMPSDENAEFLCVVRAFDEAGGPIVGFHSALTLGEALSGLYERLLNRSLKWKPDQYAR